jgi:hypothetical protein
VISAILRPVAAILLPTLAAVAGTFLIRRRLPSAVLRSSHDVSAAILSVIGTLYAVVLAFTVVIVWEHYSDAGSAAEREGTDLGDLWRLAGAFDPVDGDRVNRALVVYARAVVDREWPAMVNGRSDPETWKAMDALWSTYRSMVPRTAVQQIAYSESIRRLDELSDSRRLRLHSLAADVPFLMWLLLIVGGVVVVGFCFLFAPESVGVHALMVGLLAAMIAANLCLVSEFDNPFDGWPRIEADVMRSQLDRVIAKAPGPAATP